MPKKAASSNVSMQLLDLLSPERRREILHEAIGGTARSVIAGAKTFGHLVESLTRHDLWPHLQSLPIAAVLRSSGGASAPSAPKRGPGRPAKAAAPAAAKPAPSAKGTVTKGGFVRRSSKDIQKTVDKVLAFIKEHPGLRTEQIKKQFGGKGKAVGDALDRLRSEKKVHTSGERRATTYRAA